MNIEWVYDPGHAWLKVPYSKLAEYGMGVSTFSRYSYYNRYLRCVYLEEDCDAPLFLARSQLPACFPERYLKDSASRNEVRNLPRIGS